MTSLLRRKSEPHEIGTGRLLFLLGAGWGAIVVLLVERLS